MRTKKYVILTNGLSDMGGAEMYTENKVKYLLNNQWEVFVFYRRAGNNYMLPYLSKYRENYVRELEFPYYYVPAKYRERVEERIKTIVGNADEIVVESHLIILALWGESIAKSLSAKHIVNFLEERTPNLNVKENAFFEYKLLRHEILNASEMSLRRLFKDRYREEYNRYSNDQKYMCANVVDDNRVFSHVFDKCDYTILSVGRLNKPYMHNMVREIIKFATKYSNLKLNMIFIGGGSDKAEKEIKCAFASQKNIKLYMLGYMYPICKNLILTADVGIASSNSVLVIAQTQVPTISIDINDGLAIGVYGYTTTNFLVRGKEPCLEISELLEDVLFSKHYRQSEYNQNNSDLNCDDSLVKEMQFISNSEDIKKYYNIESIYKKCERVKGHIKWILKSTVMTMFCSTSRGRIEKM